jgi:hypothetical protein
MSAMSASSVTQPDASPFGLDPLPAAAEPGYDAPFGIEDAYGAEGTTRIVVMGGRDGPPRAVDAGAVRPRRGAPVHPLSPVSLLEAEASAVGAGRRPVRRLPRLTLRRPGAGVVPGAATITMPRAAALSVAALVAGAATAGLLVLGRPELEFASQVQVLLPLVLAIAVVGVGRLLEWAPRVWSEWRGPLGYASVAPWALLMLFTAAAPALALPIWLPPVAGVAVAAPFLWSAVGPRRLRARVRPRPDAHGRRGGMLASGVLALVAYSGLRPDLGGLLQAALFIALVVAAFTARGLADAGATWGVPAWAALVWGALVAWAFSLLAAVGASSQSSGMHLAIVGLAALPLALVSRAAGRRGVKP